MVNILCRLKSFKIQDDTIYCTLIIDVIVKTIFYLHRKSHDFFIHAKTQFYVTSHIVKIGFVKQSFVIFV